MSDLTFASSPFRIKRPLITTNGVGAAVDADVASLIKELNALLGKRIVGPPGRQPEAGLAAPQDNKKELKHPSAQTTVSELLSKPLSPKHVPGVNNADWDAGSLASELSALDLKSGLTLSDFIDMTADLSTLKYNFQNALVESFNNLDYNTTTVLTGNPAISDYLVAYAFLILKITDTNALLNFITKNQSGAQTIVGYAIVSAARTIINSEQIKVAEYNENNSAFALRIQQEDGILLSEASFKTSVSRVIQDIVFNGTQLALINKANLNIPVEFNPQLIQFLKVNTFVNESNVKFFLGSYLTQIIGSSVPIAGSAGAPPGASDQDFDVEYLQDSQSVVQVSRSSVRCAAQLYYSMILGDELDVFDAINFLTHKYLIRNVIEITDGTLRDDLQLYVFSNKFRDLKTGRINDRSRPAERQMFYRQVFNWGKGQVTEDVVVNREFMKLWKVMMLESAKYIERAQISPNPTSYVSRQSVQQAVEDLQYNLSTHCTGMANIIGPLIYAELDFVIKQILMNDQIVQQVDPQGKTWWRVVETLFVGMHNTRPRSTVLYNKAKLGNTILRLVSDYDPATFEQDGPFGNFISSIDAFITTQSILQRGLTEDLIRGQPKDDGDSDESTLQGGSTPPDRRDTEDPHSSATPAIPGLPQAGTSPAAGGDEWAF